MHASRLQERRTPCPIRTCVFFFDRFVSLGKVSRCLNSRHRNQCSTFSRSSCCAPCVCTSLGVFFTAIACSFAVHARAYPSFIFFLSSSKTPVAVIFFFSRTFSCSWCCGSDGVPPWRFVGGCTRRVSSSCPEIARRMSRVLVLCSRCCVSLCSILAWHLRVSAFPGSVEMR